MNAIENELSDVIKRDKKRLIELEFVRDGVASNLQEFLEVCKEISETLGVDIYFDIPNNNDTCNCGIYINDVRAYERAHEADGLQFRNVSSRN